MSLVDPNDVSYRLKLERKQLLEAKLAQQQGLPHLYGFPWYKWARKFFESTNKYNFLMAGNQLSKSSSQIRKAIHWATETELWSSLWRQRPLQFWYLYPTRDVATIEFEKKWEPLFMPQGLFKEHVKYGWKPEYRARILHAIHFNTGVTIYMKSYSQDVQDLQTSTADAIFCDEELPENLVTELQFRLAATDGYFHMVFTPTLGQEIWRCTMEEQGTKDELFRGAFKQQVSMYDCLEYEDGSPTPWSRERIKRIEANCKSEAEVQRRVYGRCVVDGGLTYPGFSRTRNVKIPESKAIPPDWHIYAGVDLGTGGEKNHPAAIVFVAIRPDFQFGRIFKAWRGDKIETTSSDILTQFVRMRGRMRCVSQTYDWQSKDFHIVATRAGESFLPAQKGHDYGEGVLNTLFKSGMLVVDDDPELKPLVIEFANLKKEGDKRRKKDDLCFVAGTLIATSQGLKPIEALDGSEQILTRRGYRQILALMNREKETVALEFSNGESLTCTPNHPIWVEGKGFVPAEALTPSDTLCTLQENVVRLTKRSNSKIQPVYNLTVAQEHEYFANGILVSNCDATRYACVGAPWDFSCIDLDRPVEEAPKAPEMSELERQRRGLTDEEELEEMLRVFDPDEEMQAWQELMES